MSGRVENVWDKKADMKKRLELILPLYFIKTKSAYIFGLNITTNLKTIQSVETKVFHIFPYKNIYHFE